MALAQIDSLALKMTMSQIKMYNDIHEQYHVIHDEYYLKNNEIKLQTVYDISEACESVIDSINSIGPLVPRRRK